MRFTLQHPQDPTCKAVYGFDRAIGWFIEVRSNSGLLAEYDALCAPDNRMAGIIQVMISHGFFSADHLAETRSFLPYVADVKEIEEPGVRRAVEVVLNLKSGAGRK